MSITTIIAFTLIMIGLAIGLGGATWRLIGAIESPLAKALIVNFTLMVLLGIGAVIGAAWSEVVK